MSRNSDGSLAGFCLLTFAAALITVPFCGIGPLIGWLIGMIGLAAFLGVLRGGGASRKGACRKPRQDS